MTAPDDPEWWRGAVVYHVYPRSFFDANADGLGDLPGVAAKIPYLAQLGVDAIWLSPFFRSPMRDMGYDVSDYCDVDPSFGTLDDFKTLLAAAHDAGLKVIIDQVYAHTSDQHPWFTESRAARESPRADWYIWADPKPDGTPPNNWLSVFGGPAWEWEPRRRQYYLHHFLAEQPQINVFNPDVRAAILDVADFWLELGVDGFRLDVANYYVYDAQLRDNPAKDHPGLPHRPYTYQRHLYDRSRPETFEFLKPLRDRVDAKPGRMTVAEVFSDSQLARTIDYASGPDRLHTAYGFWFLGDEPLTAERVREAMEAWEHADAWPSWSFSNHDVPRAPTRWGRDRLETDPRFAKLLLTLLLCLRGTIFLYQGEELGLPQADVPFDKLQDPEGIRFWPHSLGRDGCRTPMPWNAAAPHAGFSTCEPWLPVDPRHLALAVDAQAGVEGSVLEHARSLIALRRASTALRTGGLEFHIVDGDALAFSRIAEGERIVCAFNLGGEELRLALAEVEGGEVVLDPFGAGLVRKTGAG